MSSRKTQKRAKSVSPLKKQQNMRKSLRQRRVRSMRKTRSLNDLSKEVPDDLTRDTNARTRINGKQNMKWKGNNGIPLKYQSEKTVPWKGKASLVDMIQRYPRELQSKMFKMGRMDNPINSRNLELNAAALDKSSQIPLKKLLQSHNRPFLEIIIYDRAWAVFHTNFEYNTPYFYNDKYAITLVEDVEEENETTIHDLDDFKSKTKIEYKLQNDCILFRVVPIDHHNNYKNNVYDGFISNQKNGKDRFQGMNDISKRKQHFMSKGYKQIRPFHNGEYSYYIVHIDTYYNKDEDGDDKWVPNFEYMPDSDEEFDGEFDDFENEVLDD